jgi:MFS family permease
VLVVFALMGLHFGAEQYGFPKLVRDGLGISAKSMGWMYLCIGALLAGVAFFVREFFERHPKHFYYFGIALILSGVFQGLTFLAQGLASLLAIRLCHVVGDALVLTMSGVVVASIFPGGRMGGNVGFVNLINAIGQFGGTFFSGFAIQTAVFPERGFFGRHVAVFSVSGVIMVVCGLLFIVFRKRFGVAEKEPDVVPPPES